MKRLKRLRALLEKRVGLAAKEQSPTRFIMRGRPEYARYEVGEWSYGNPRIEGWGEASTLRVGKFCSFAEGVTILLGGEHRTDWVTTYPFTRMLASARGFVGHPASRGDVVIGHDVWCGWSSTIMSGVQIGNGAVVGAHSVVTRDVPPYAVVVGNPAQLKRLRFPEAQVEKLLQIAWWDWPMDKIERALPLLLSQDLAAFCEQHG